MSIVEKPLTKRQRDFVAAVAKLSRIAGYPPSLGEIAAHLQVSSTRAAVLGRECEARGFAKHTPRIPRSWRVTR